MGGILHTWYTMGRVAPKYLQWSSIWRRDQILEELKKYLLRAQQIMKKQVDGHRKDVQFEAGDHVYLKLRPYKWKTVANWKNEKLAPRYFRPFEILEKVAVAYRLRLSPITTIHPVFYVSQLRRAIGDQATNTELLASLAEDMEVVLEPSELEGV